MTEPVVSPTAARQVIELIELGRDREAAELAYAPPDTDIESPDETGGAACRREPGLITCEVPGFPPAEGA